MKTQASVAVATVLVATCCHAGGRWGHVPEKIDYEARAQSERDRAVLKQEQARKNRDVRASKAKAWLNKQPFPWATPTDLRAAYRSNILRASDQYNRTIHLVGIVEEIGQTEDHQPILAMGGVGILLKRSERPAAAALNIGQGVIIRGYCHGPVDDADGIIVLTDATIVRVSSRR